MAVDKTAAGAVFLSAGLSRRNTGEMSDPVMCGLCSDDDFKMRALIVEDEKRLARNIARALEEATSFAVDISTDGEDGLYMALSNPYDLIVLDLMLPKVKGLEILQNLRCKGQRTPVLILTACDTTNDIIQGLDSGGDDYLTKPFETGELIARCKALVRRSYDRPDPVISIGELSVDTVGHVVTFRGKQVVLPAMEYRLLEYLALRAGEIVSAGFHTACGDNRHYIYRGLY